MKIYCENAYNANVNQTKNQNSNYDKKFEKYQNEFYKNNHHSNQFSKNNYDQNAYQKFVWNIQFVINYTNYNQNYVDVNFINISREIIYIYRLCQQFFISTINYIDIWKNVEKFKLMMSTFTLQKSNLKIKQFK